MEGSEIIFDSRGLVALWVGREQMGENQTPQKKGAKKMGGSHSGRGAHLLDILHLTLQLVDILLMDHLISRPPLQVHLQERKQYYLVKEPPGKLIPHRQVHTLLVGR